MKPDNALAPFSSNHAMEASLIHRPQARRIPEQIRRGATVVALATAMLLVGDVRPALAQAVDLVVVNIADVAAGYRASKLIGKIVMNDKNEKIGSLDDMIVDKEHVLFAILQVGGFLGVGGHLLAVPFNNLTLEDAGSKIVLPGASKEALKKLPEFKYAA
jgi:sporulation protein YlmC with PRC-barrel domain